MKQLVAGGELRPFHDGQYHQSSLAAGPGIAHGVSMRFPGMRWGLISLAVSWVRSIFPAL